MYEHKYTHMHAYLDMCTHACLFSFVSCIVHVIASLQETGFKRKGKEVKVLKVVIS